METRPAARKEKSERERRGRSAGAGGGFGPRRETAAEEGGEEDPSPTSPSMPAQHQPQVKEWEANGKTELSQQGVFSEGEGTKTGKLPMKEPQTRCKKKTRKIKKKKTSQDNGKHPSQSKKQPVFVKSPQSDGEMPQDDATKVSPGQRTRHLLFASTSAFSFLTQGDSEMSSESLRWDGILDDPIAEEERLWKYRQNRRKRYGEYIQQNLPPEPSFTLRNLPQLCKVVQMSQEHRLCKSKSSASTSSGQEKPKQTEF